MTVKIPVTSGGLSEDEAIEAGKLLREGWDVLRSLQFNKTASILRYVVVQEGKPHLGIEEQRQLVSGLADLPVYVTRVSTREVMVSNGKIELTDMMFIFYAEVRETDEILWDGKTYKVVQLKYYDPSIGRSMVIGRMI
jgi:hypothetical protein